MLRLVLVLAFTLLVPQSALRHDPQFGMGVEANAFPLVSNARAVVAGQKIEVGTLSVSAYPTPGHAGRDVLELAQL